MMGKLEALAPARFSVLLEEGPSGHHPLHFRLLGRVAEARPVVH